jgi:hypothetical protein
MTIFFSRKTCHWWDNVEKYCRAGQDTSDNMHMLIARWIPNATPQQTHTNYVKLTAFSMQQRLQESASEFRHTYIVCLVRYINVI